VRKIIRNARLINVVVETPREAVALLAAGEADALSHVVPMLSSAQPAPPGSRILPGRRSRCGGGREGEGARARRRGAAFRRAGESGGFRAAGDRARRSARSGGQPALSRDVRASRVRRLHAAMIGSISVSLSALLPSSSGPGRRPLTAKTGVRVP
jgi:hypothetical protein